ncbi:MAG: hypothetical protein GF331_11160 [Chitinivibrionales bacterium]|nr:hypothetical protein [Chitinivibrionales bacterium]
MTHQPSLCRVAAAGLLLLCCWTRAQFASAGYVLDNLRDTTIECDYLIVTPELFMQQAVKLAKHRAGYGADDVEAPRVAVLDTATAQFPVTDSLRHHVSLWHALKYARERWHGPPRYIVLLGDDSVGVDTTDTTSLSYGHMPTFCDYFAARRTSDTTSYLQIAYTDAYYRSTWDSVPPSPNRLGPCTAAVAVGRIPCETADECTRYVDKLIRMEKTASFGVSSNSVFLAADDSYQGDSRDYINHTGCAEILSTWDLRGFFKDKTYLGMYERDTAGMHVQARLGFAERTRAGGRWWIYFGHGHTTVLTDERFLRGDDAPDCGNDSVPSLFFSFSCHNGDFARGDTVAMCKRYLFEPGNGCIGYLASTYYEFATPNLEFARCLLGEVPPSPPLSLGYAFVGALHQQLGRRRPYFHVLGDPAIQLRKRTVKLHLSAALRPDTTTSAFFDVAEGERTQYSYHYRIVRTDTVVLPDLPDRTWLRDTTLDSGDGSGVPPFEVLVAPEHAAAPFKVIAFLYNESVEARADSLFEPTVLAAVAAHAIPPTLRVRCRLRGSQLIVSAPMHAAGAEPWLRILTCDGREVLRRRLGTNAAATVDLRAATFAAGSYAVMVSGDNCRHVTRLVWDGQR